MSPRLASAIRASVDVPRLAQALGRIVGDRHVVLDEAALQPFSKDETHGLQPVMPHCAVRPSDGTQVQQVVDVCRQLNVPLTPRGAGSGRSGGCVPVHGGVVMAFDRMASILEVDPADGVAVVEPGVVLQALQERVESVGLFYPPDPASLSWCTLGGNVAENAGGPRALKYGVTRDHVLGAEVVLPTGERCNVGRRTMKGVSGYDLAALMCGSEGTLGVLTRLTLRLLPLPRHVETALFCFGTARDAASAVTAIMQSGVHPRTLEYLDAMTLEAVRPVSRCPLPQQVAAALVVETDGNHPEGVFADLQRAAEVAQQHHATQVLVAQGEAQRADIWDMRHKLSAATRAITGHKVSEDVVVPRGRVVEMVAQVAAVGEALGLRTCAFGHAGDGNLHVQILVEDPVRQKDAVARCLTQMTRAALALGGVISGEHGVGVAKRHLLSLEQGPEVLALQRRIKHAFDPTGFLNPGKIFPEENP